MSVKLTILHDPFDESQKTVYEEEYVNGKTLIGYIGDKQLLREGEAVAFAVNGEIVVPEYVCEDGAHIVATVKIGVTAGASAFATWLFASGAPVAATATTAAVSASFAWTAAYSVAQFALTMAFNYAVGYLMQEYLTDDPVQNPTASQTHGWGALQQVNTPGYPIPILFGTHKMAGCVIAQSNEYLGNNKEYLNVLLGLCEGPIDTITNIQLNDQPISYFGDCDTYIRLGTKTDAVIPEFSEIATQVSFSKKLKQNPTLSIGPPVWPQTWDDIDDIIEADPFPYATSVTVQTNGNAVTKIKIDVVASKGLYGIRQSSHVGRLYAINAKFMVQYRIVGDTNWVNTGIHIITGDAGSPATAARKQVILSDLPPAQYEILVIKIYNRHPYSQNELWWQGISEIFEEEFIYPSLAKYGIKALATDQLSGNMPRITCIATKNTVQIYDIYGEAWVAKSARNPAWATYALLNTYGPIEKEYIDYDAFLEWAEYCDEIIDDQKRHEINLVIDTVDTIWMTVQKVAKLGRGVIVRQGMVYKPLVSSLVVNVSHLFTMGNIIKDSFSMQYMGTADRSNAIEVSYNDETMDYTRQSIIVFSKDATEEDFAKKASIDLTGITDRTRIIRECNFRINQNKWLVRTVTFEAAIDSFACTIGDLFYFQHEIPDYETGKSGRILSSTNAGAHGFVVLDKEVTLEVGTGYAILVRMPDTDELIEKEVASTSYELTTSTLTLTSRWDVEPAKEAIYVFGKVLTYKKKYRLVNSSRNSNLTKVITGVEYIEDVYDDAAGIHELEEWSPAYQEATSVTAYEILSYNADNGYYSQIHLSWFPTVTAQTNWVIWIQSTESNTTPVVVGTTTDLHFIIGTDFFTIGQEYKIFVVSEGQGAVELTDNTYTITPLGKEAPPSDVTLFSAEFDAITRRVNFTWANIDDMDLAYYEIRMNGTDWDSATVIVTQILPNHASYFLEEDLTAPDIRFWIKAVDTTGNWSEHAIYTEIDIDTTNNGIQVPTGLRLISDSTLTSDGQDVALLLATWDRNAEVDPNFHHYELQRKDVSIGKVAAFNTTENSYQWEVRPNTEYAVRVNAVAMGFGQLRTDFGAWVTIVTAKDTNPPAVPTNLSAVSFFNSIRMSWNHSNELDLSHFKLYRNTEDNFGTAGVVGNPVSDFNQNFSMVVDTPEDYQKYYYWVTAVDNSGNESAATESTFGQKLQADTVNITENAITAPLIQAAAIVADKIAVNAVDATKINVGELSAISANMGTITAGILQSENWGVASGTKFSLNDEIFILGGSDNPALSWDGNTLKVRGIIEVEGGAAGSITYSDIIGQKPPVDADHTASNTAHNTLYVNGTPAYCVDNWAWPYNKTEINGGVIATDTVYARSIVAGGITAEKIAANAITAEKIQVETITADRIYANAYLGAGRLDIAQVGFLGFEREFTYVTHNNTFTSPAMTFTISHNLGRLPQITTGNMMAQRRDGYWYPLLPWDYIKRGELEHMYYDFSPNSVKVRFFEITSLTGVPNAGNNGNRYNISFQYIIM